MGMSMHDRYYEPEDDDYEDMDDYIDDFVEFEMRKGGDYDPTEEMNFLEAVSECGLPEELERWEDANEDEQKQVIEYWESIARYKGEESYFANL
jgi:hypothetical protein